MKDKIVAEREALRKVISRQLRTAMLGRGWDLAELSRMADIRIDAISRYANAEKFPSVCTLDKLATALGVTTDWLLGREATVRFRRTPEDTE